MPAADGGQHKRDEGQINRIMEGHVRLQGGMWGSTAVAPTRVAKKRGGEGARWRRGRDRIRDELLPNARGGILFFFFAETGGELTMGSRPQ